MDLNVTTLEGKAAGKVTLTEAIFGLEPRADILQRMIRYQLLGRMAGTHDVKNRGDVHGTTRKFMRQKGTGGARHGTRKVNIFRGGGRSFGPTPRSHAIELPKKIRALALRHALSDKARGDKLIVIADAAVKDAKTKGLVRRFAKLGLVNALIVDGRQVEANFALAARNIVGVDVLPVQGINVYDILRRDTLVLTRAAVAALTERFA
ncbi:MAG: 50S ribosomal protein L4 [Cucumibacter sp.]